MSVIQKTASDATSQTEDGTTNPVSMTEYRPAVCALRPEGETPWWHTHIYIRAGSQSEGNLSLETISLHSLIQDCLEKVSEDDPAANTFSDSSNIRQLLESFHSVLQNNPVGTGPQKIVNGAVDKFLDSLSTKEKIDDNLKETLLELLSELNEPGWIAGQRRADLGHLFTIAQNSHRNPPHEHFRQKALQLAVKLENRLQVDFLHTEEGQKPETLAGSFGNDDFKNINAETLAQNLPTYRGALQLGKKHRARLEKTVATLRHRLNPDDEKDLFILLSSPNASPDFFPHLADKEFQTDVFQSAIECFDRTAGEWVEFFRAIRTAQLEVENAYEPDIHDDAIAGLDWNSLTTEEFHLIPPVVALENSKSVNGELLESLNRLLDSGRPVIILLTDEANGFVPGTPQTIFGATHGGLAATLTARGDAFILQSSLARPEHLLTGFSKMIGAYRPGLALVNVPDPAEEDKLALGLLNAALESHTNPCFIFNPDNGSSWKDCFDLQGNPQCESIWPKYEINIGDSSQPEGMASASIHFTLADYAALKSNQLSDLTLISSSDWTEHQYPLAEYLERLPTVENAAIPYILAVDEKGSLARVLVSDQLAQDCMERIRGWRLLQELGGINNDYALHAVNEAKEKVATQNAEELTKLLSDKNIELEKIRRQAARETIERLVAMLLGESPPNIAALLNEEAQIDFGAIENTVASVASDSDLLKEPDSSQTNKEKTEELVCEDPYIDSALCTTCNECTNLNSLLFKYNDNKQAYIADASAGTFAQLVKAAAKCPALCIHPGKPRPGDKTATARLIDQAAQYN